MEKGAVEELNTLLKGEQMAVEAFERFIENVDNDEVKTELQNMQKDHKNNSAKIAEKIQNLGGKVGGGTGIAGVMSNLKMKLDGIDNWNTLEILQKAYDGEDQGIAAAEKSLGANMDRDSAEIMEQVLSKDHDHLKKLAKMIEKYEEKH